LADAQKYCGHLRNMSKRVLINLSFLLLPIVMVGVVLLAGFAGSRVGRYYRLKDVSASKENAGPEMQQSSQSGAEKSVHDFDPPVAFGFGTATGVDQAAIEEEVRMAAEANIHTIVVPLTPDWTSGDSRLSTSCEILDAILRANPNAKFFLKVDLNPTETWLKENPTARARISGEESTFACISSPTWIETVRTILSTTISFLQNKKYPLVGYIPECLAEGCWQYPLGYDSSEMMVNTFSEWLKTRYNSVEALRSAWGNPDISFETVQMPTMASDETKTKVLLSLPGEQAVLDANLFFSELVADTIATVTATIKKHAGKDARILVPYGFTFESNSPGSGHFALARLLDSPIDGFVSPISYFDRGIGGVGGFMGPVHSVIDRGKWWYLIDDTRTGVSRDPSSGAPLWISGIRLEDVERVLERNFVAAVTQNIGIVWMDRDSKGAFFEPRLWKSFSEMRQIYEDVRRLRSSKSFLEDIFDPYQRDVVNVVIDENSRLVQCNNDKLNRVFLLSGRDAALVCGLPTRFYLLSDVLGGKAKPASVYLFLNTFCLTTDERSMLHQLLASNGATAIWTYAAGYFGDTPSAENITATTGIKVAMFEQPVPGGSVCPFDANVLQKGQVFGESIPWQPLFYIDDPDTNLSVLAHYRENEKPSVAIKFMPEGWTSVYFAEPCVDPSVLREVLLILEKSVMVETQRKSKYDAMYFGRHLIGIHGRDETYRERVILVDRPYNVDDLLDPKVGWTNRMDIDIPLSFGETRLLRFNTPTIGRLELRQPVQNDNTAE